MKVTQININKCVINIVNKTHKTIIKHNSIKLSQRILIAMSGGQDSICLFFILLHLKTQWKWTFGILYCNHFWQINSFYTSSLVFRLGFLFSIPTYLNVPVQNIFSEQKSRNWRYSEFGQLSLFYNYNLIVAGHTATDRIETIMFSLIRGTGTKGISALSWNRLLYQEKIIQASFPSLFKVYQSKSYRRISYKFRLNQNKIVFPQNFNLKIKQSLIQQSLLTEAFFRLIFLKNSDLIQSVYFAYFKDFSILTLKRLSLSTIIRHYFNVYYYKSNKCKTNYLNTIAAQSIKLKQQSWSGAPFQGGPKKYFKIKIKFTQKKYWAYFKNTFSGFQQYPQTDFLMSQKKSFFITSCFFSSFYFKLLISFFKNYFNKSFNFTFLSKAKANTIFLKKFNLSGKLLFSILKKNIYKLHNIFLEQIIIFSFNTKFSFKEILIYRIIKNWVFLNNTKKNKKKTNFNNIKHNLNVILPTTTLFHFSKINLSKLLLFRPLLFLSRFDLKQLCVFWKLPLYPDNTNENVKYSRNRIRKQLLPLLRYFFNPQIDKLFLQFAEIANAESVYLNFISIRLKKEFQLARKTSFELKLTLFNFLPLAIQRQLLKQFLNSFLKKKIKYFHVEFLLNLLMQKT